MNREEFRNQLTQFMSDNKFTHLIDEICAAEEIRSIGKEIYDNFSKCITLFLSKAPEDLCDQVTEALVELDEYSFEVFMEDFRVNLENYEYNAIQPALALSDKRVCKDFICHAAREAITIDNPRLIKKATEIFENMANLAFNALVGVAFDGYIPAEVEEDDDEDFGFIIFGDYLN